MCTPVSRLIASARCLISFNGNIIGSLVTVAFPWPLHAATRDIAVNLRWLNIVYIDGLNYGGVMHLRDANNPCLLYAHFGDYPN